MATSFFLTAPYWALSKPPCRAAVGGESSSLGKSGAGQPGGPQPITVRTLALIEKPSLCTPKGGSQAALLGLGVAYNSFLKPLAAAQKYLQANWPGEGYERGKGLLLTAAAAGFILWVVAVASAVGATWHMGTPLAVSFTSGTYYGSLLSAAFGEILQGMLATGVYPFYSLAVPAVAGVAINVGS